jgi:hypothetical protein
MKVAAALAAQLIAAPLGAQVSWRYEQPAGTPHTAHFANRLITESSGVAASRAQPGVLWTFNDSGNDPILFATDTLGRDRGAFRVTGAINEDWEAIALGPCGARQCLFIGDIGDNDNRRRDVVIYRVVEPRVSGSSRAMPATAAARALHVRYPDGPHDAESLMLSRTGDLFIITKAGKHPLLYRIPAAAWGRHRAVTADSLGPLPIDSDMKSFRLVTDAAIAPDGVRVAVRTYREIYFLRLADGRLVPEDPPRACDTFGLQIQGEGLDWLDQHTLVLTSESAFIQGGTVAVITCPAIQ